MPWRWATLRGQRVLAQVSATGEFVSNGGRVEIRYKAGDPRAYHAAVRNLALDGSELLPDDTCPPAAASDGATSKKPAKKTSLAAPVTHDPKAYVAYTDGACKGNPGVASSACVLTAPDGSVIEEALYLGHATNNVAELAGIEQAIVLAPDDHLLIVHTDSKYAIGVLSQGWKAKANQEMIARIKARLQNRKVRFVYVPGHAGVPLNERADELANEAIAAGKSSKVARPGHKPAS